MLWLKALRILLVVKYILQTIVRQMVVNKRLKMMKNYKTTITKSGRPRFREVLIIGFSLGKIVFWIDGR